MAVSNQNCDVVITGAGPSSLFLANQIKILSPHLNVVLLEKREDYNRTQPIRLKPSSFSGIPDHPELKAIVDRFKQKKVVKINVIEQELKTLALKLGIDIRIQEVVHPRLLPQQFPNAKFFIGADGAHSTVRKEIFKENLQFKSKLQHLVEVKYDVLGSTSVLNSKVALLNSRTLVQEGVSKRGEKTTVSLRFFVDASEYEKMKGARLSTPYKFNSHSHLIPPQVLTTINQWIDARKTSLGEKRIENSEIITAIPLEIYATKTFLKEGEKPGTTWGLIGDAAMGLPFFRSLNASFLSGTVLARGISNSYLPTLPLWRRLMLPLVKWISRDSIDGKVPDSLLFSAAYMRVLSSIEAVAARIKSFGIQILRLFIKNSSLSSTKVYDYTTSTMDYYKRKFGLAHRLIKYGSAADESPLSSLINALNEQNGNKVNEALNQLESRQANKLYELLWMEQRVKPEVWQWGEFAFRNLHGHSASLETKIQSVAKLQEMVRLGF